MSMEWLIATLLTLGGSVVGVVVWSIRQEGRINGHDRLFEERKAQDTIRQSMHDDRHKDIKDRLERIERKLDRLNGSNHE